MNSKRKGKNGRSKRKEIRAAMTQAERLIRKAALAFRTVCEQSKDRGARTMACNLFKNLSRAGGTLDTGRDFVDLIK